MTEERKTFGTGTQKPVQTATPKQTTPSGSTPPSTKEDPPTTQEKVATPINSPIPTNKEHIQCIEALITRLNQTPLTNERLSDPIVQAIGKLRGAIVKLGALNCPKE